MSLNTAPETESGSLYFFIAGQNVDSMIFKEVMHELGKKLGHTGKDFMDA